MVNDSMKQNGMGKTNVLLSGYDGAMGAVVFEVADLQKFNVIAFDDSGDFATCDVVLDFSHPNMLDRLLRFAVENKKPVVIATTGFSAEQEQQIAEAAKIVPVVRSNNFSLSVRKFIRATATFAKSWDGDIEIVETHHNMKKDAPSGTALTIGNALIEARGFGRLVLGRTTEHGQRKEGDIGISAIRGGSVAGEHEVRFFSPTCEVRMSEREYGKQSFALGALEACVFAIGKKPRLYTMDDLVE